MTESTARLRAIRLTNFRNFEQLELSVPPEGFVLIGDNGQGKTNLLEAIYYAQVFRSARGARDADLVRLGCDAFHIHATVRREHWREVGIGFERSTQRKRVRVDGDVVEKLALALGLLPCVMFSPDDVALVAGPPSGRRRFLDIMLALSSPAYLASLTHYRVALGQRNALLRRASRHSGERVDAASIAVWDVPLIRHGAVLVEARRRWVASEAGHFAQLCTEIGLTEDISIGYTETLESEREPAEALAEAFESRRAGDLRRGFTQVGPHRDDLSVLLAQRELRVFGSAGQQRTAAIVLRMLEAATLARSVGGQPLLLLDDPFAELDQARAARVLRMLTERERGQTILTVPKASDVPAELTALPRSHVRAGQIS